MCKRLVNFLMLILPFGLLAQTGIENVLLEIESNNTKLSAFRNLNKAQKLENKTGIFLENPELGFNYLWGDPAAMGNRKDFSVSQSFDFPTAYGIKKEIADVKNIQSDLNFELNRKTILYQAKTICNQLVYLNALNDALTTRMKHAEAISLAYKAKFEMGEINILENNKARFNLLNTQKELEVNETEREVLLAELTTLNGGKRISFIQNTFSPVNLPVDFANWYSDYESKNLILQQANNEIGISEKQIKLSKALSLPKFSGGYMSESVVGESFKGVSLGMSIPLWEKKNTVKLATAQQQVALQLVTDKKVQSYNQLKGQYKKAITLQKTLVGYREALQTVNSTELLKKALDAGELSLIEYMLELTLYYETNDKLLSLENELSQIAAGLYFFEL